MHNMFNYTAAVPHLGLYHPFPLDVYFDCIGSESSLSDCVATESLEQCNSQNIAGVQCMGEIVEGKFTIFCSWSKLYYND